MDATEQAPGANVFSLSRPLHPLMPQTRQFQELEEYAYQNQIQTLFHDTLQHLFAERPDDPLKFVVEHLQKQLKERDAAANKA